MKNADLFLFCGGPTIDSSGVAKPLMKVNAEESLIKCYLQHLASSEILPDKVILLCDTGQKKDFDVDLLNFQFPIPIEVLECSKNSNTFEKFLFALKSHDRKDGYAYFSYPDIFFFGEMAKPDTSDKFFNDGAAITVATLSSRFPRLVVDVYSNDIKGISDHTSLMPANPLHVFGGTLYGKKETLTKLSKEFLENQTNPNPSLENDLFFWLINQARVKAIMLYGDWLLVDSARDVRRLLERLIK